MISSLLNNEKISLDIWVKKWLVHTVVEDIKKEGLENIDSNIILTKRAVQYLGLTQKNIVESYERSIKKG